MDTYGDKIRLVFRDFPLPFHDNAHIASEAAQCAHEQGKFWDYHDKLFENQRALGADNLKTYATDIGLDGEAFNACFDSGRFKSRVDQDYQYGQTVGVTGTPAFFINGRFLSGAQPFEAFKAIIDEELQMKNIATN
jgi:protein-disulfide isomerase